MSLTFEQLPKAVEQANLRLERIEKLLREHNQLKPVSDPDKKFLVPGASDYCKMPIPTFRKHLKDGNVIGSKPGKSWIFLKKDLDAFLAKYRSKSKEELEEKAEEIIVSKGK